MSVGTPTFKNTGGLSTGGSDFGRLMGGGYKPSGRESDFDRFIRRRFYDGKSNIPPSGGSLRGASRLAGRRLGGSFAGRTPAGRALRLGLNLLEYWKVIERRRLEDGDDGPGWYYDQGRVYVQGGAISGAYGEQLDDAFGWTYNRFNFYTNSQEVPWHEWVYIYCKVIRVISSYPNGDKYREVGYTARFPPIEYPAIERERYRGFPGGSIFDPGLMPPNRSGSPGPAPGAPPPVRDVTIEFGGGPPRWGDPPPKHPPPPYVHERKGTFSSEQYAAMRLLADLLGNIVEFADILGEAAGLPHWWTPQRKLAELFLEGRVAEIDLAELARLIVENELEDALYGRLGKYGREAAEQLGLPLGPQTGPAM